MSDTIITLHPFDIYELLVAGDPMRGKQFGDVLEIDGIMYRPSTSVPPKTKNVF